jgi:hypothetical protein
MQFKKIVKLLAIWAAVIAAPLAAKAIGLSDLRVMGIYLLLAFLWLLYQIEQLKTVTGKGWRDDYQKVVQEIKHGKPIEPKHNPPSRLGEDGLESFVTDTDRMLFRDFEAFGVWVNQQLQHDGWRLQELPRTADGGSPGPFGRMYTIHYNALQVGQLEIFPDRTEEMPHLFANIEIDHAQLFPYGTIGVFLRELCFYLTAETYKARDRITMTVESALTGFPT